MLLLEFLNFMNSRHPDIIFTIEHTEQNEEHMVSYLDLSISVSNGILAWELYIKPSHSGVHLSYDTALPYEVKRSVAIEQFRRARRNASTEEGKEKGMLKIVKLLAENGYPTSIIESAREQSKTCKRSKRCTKPAESILKLPFVHDRLARDVRRAVRAFSKEVRVVFQRGQSLGDMLVSSSIVQPKCPRELSRKKRRRARPPECRACDAGLPTGKCMKNNVVYSMFCLECEAEYIGETERSIRERFAEHYRQARALTPGTPWGAHYALHHRACQTASAKSFKPFGRASILATENSQVNRRILEATFVRDRDPAVNNDCGWKLLDYV